MKALDTQIGGNHYKHYKMQPVEYFEKMKLKFIAASIIKYIVRYRDKNGLEDLNKAMHLCDIGIEIGLTPRVMQKSRRNMYNEFVSQLGDNMELEKTIIFEVSQYRYDRAIDLIDDLKQSYSHDVDEFDYYDALFELVYKDGFDYSLFTSQNREDSGDFKYLCAFVFVLHKYDVPNSLIANKANLTLVRVANLINSAYSMLEDGDAAFIIDMNAMFDYIEKERLKDE